MEEQGQEEVAVQLPEPVQVFYDPITGVPPEFNEVLPQTCPEYQRWKEGQQEGNAETSGERSTDAIEKGIGNVSMEDIPKKGKKSKKPSAPEILIDKQTRSKKKSVTTVTGLDLFNIKLPEAAKVFGKKFACGASVSRNAHDKEQVEIQGDVLYDLAELLVEKYGGSGIKEENVYFMNGKTKEKFFG